MERDELSLRQMMVLLATALLAPATDLLPGLTARTAGSAGWLAALGALPLLLIALWAGAGICRGGGPCQALGRAPGGILTVLYLIWTLLTLTLALRLSAARLAEIYGDGPAFLCAAALLAVAVWMGLGKTSAFARAGEIFYLALAVALAGVLLLAAFKVEGSNFRLSGPEAAALPGASAAAAGLILNVFPAAVLGRKVTVRPHSRRRAVGWAVAFCAAVTLLLGAVISCLGPQLTARLSSPFLIMVQGLGVKGAFQRTEALFAALWALSDLTLISLLLHTWRELAGQLCPGKGCRWSILPAAIAALAGGWLISPTAEKAREFCGEVLPIVGLIFGLICPLLALILLRIRKKEK
ncbi:MAG: spore gernimation protein [Oscillospiraceae bacterium]